MSASANSTESTASYGNLRRCSNDWLKKARHSPISTKRDNGTNGKERKGRKFSDKFFRLFRDFPFVPYSPLVSSSIAYRRKDPSMREAVVVASSRTPLAKSFRGSLNLTRPDDQLAHCIKDVLRKTPQLDHSEVEDVITGCGYPAGVQGSNIARVAALLP